MQTMRRGVPPFLVEFSCIRHSLPPERRRSSRWLNLHFLRVKEGTCKLKDRKCPVLCIMVKSINLAHRYWQLSQCVDNSMDICIHESLPHYRRDNFEFLLKSRMIGARNLEHILSIEKWRQRGESHVTSNRNIVEILIVVPSSPCS